MWKIKKIRTRNKTAIAFGMKQQGLSWGPFDVGTKFNIHKNREYLTKTILKKQL